MRSFHPLTIVLAAALAALAGCDAAEAPPPPAPSPAAHAEQAAPSTPAPAPAGPIVATVGGREVPKAAFDDYLAFKRLERVDEPRRKRLLEDYLQREALAAAIEEQGVLDEARLRTELNEFRKEMLISRYFEQYLAGTVTDEAVRNYYTEHVADYEQRKVKVAHILIRTDRGMGEPERQAKLTTARAAHAKIRAGEPFADVARAFSEDTVSGKRGGSLGWLQEGAIDARFSQTAFSLEPGEVSEPFETPFGFHILTVLEGPVVARQPFDAVKGDIRHMLRNRAKDAELERLLGVVAVAREEGSQ